MLFFSSSDLAVPSATLLDPCRSILRISTVIPRALKKENITKFSKVREGARGRSLPHPRPVAMMAIITLKP
jgi:hypothetical protein